MYEGKNTDIQLSKCLSWLLRHGATKENLHISPEGYVNVNSILEHKSIHGRFSKEDLIQVVKHNNKQRFSLRNNPVSGALEIKANQGHSIVGVSDAELRPILEPKYNTIVHGTYTKCWPLIKSKGLSRMGRRHIHFAKGTKDDNSIISGLRGDSQIYIFIDLRKALGDGIKFFESANGVILTPGNQTGYLNPKYFKKVVKATTGMFVVQTFTKFNKATFITVIIILILQLINS